MMLVMFVHGVGVVYDLEDSCLMDEDD